MISNTHYNLIDTMILGFGIPFWENLTDVLFAALHGNENIRQYSDRNVRVGISTRMETHRYHSEKLIGLVDWKHLEELYAEETGKELILQNQIKFTFCELFMWATTEAWISEDWGYGFKKNV